MSCLPLPPPVILGLAPPPDGAAVSEEDGVYTLGFDGSAPTTGQVLVPVTPIGPVYAPTIFRWGIVELTDVLAFGLSFGAEGLLGPGLQNLYYTSDGNLIQDGAIIQSVQPLRAGDVLELWYDPVAQLAEYILNGVRVV